MRSNQHCKLLDEICDECRSGGGWANLGSKAFSKNIDFGNALLQYEKRCRGRAAVAANTDGGMRLAHLLLIPQRAVGRTALFPGPAGT
jgi:hypothetical protein